jgi:predicted permease
MITSQTFSALFESILSMFLMIIPGFILRKCKIGGESLPKAITDVVLYVSTPAMLIKSFLVEFDIALLSNMLAVFLLSLISHLICVGAAFLFFRRKEGFDERVYRFACVFANAGYMGIPLLSMVFGSEAAIYAAIYLIWFYIFHWTLGCLIFTGEKKYMTLKKAIVNPAVIPIIIGVAVFASSCAEYVPSVISGVASSLSGTVAPLSMLLVGLRLADVSFKAVLKNSKFYLVLFLRGILCPALTYAVMAIGRLAGLEIHDIAMSSVLVCSATPVAVATSIFAEKYGGDTKLASQIVSASTLLALGTIPLVSTLLLIPI